MYRIISFKLEKENQALNNKYIIAHHIKFNKGTNVF
jgi:hypothetical protein